MARTDSALAQRLKQDPERAAQVIRMRERLKLASVLMRPGAEATPFLPDPLRDAGQELPL